MIRVLVVDDHALVREALAILLDAAEGIVVVGQCADGGEVLGVAAEADADVVVMDADMPITSGLGATRQLMAARPAVRVLILTGSSMTATPRKAAEAGAVGYMTKSGRPERFIEAIRTVASGGNVWPPGYQPQAG